MTLAPDQRAFLEASRRAVLATIGPGGRPRQVPICFAVVETDAVEGTDVAIFSPLDEKLKRVADPRDLARVRDVRAHPGVSLLVDRWDEDWRRLAWMRVDATAHLVEPGGPAHTVAIAALRARYPQYRAQALELRPLLRLDPSRVSSWAAAEE